MDKQHFWYWPVNNPRQLHECPLPSKHVTVWCEVVNCGIIGQDFNEEDVHAITVKSECYNVNYCCQNFADFALTPDKFGKHSKYAIPRETGYSTRYGSACCAELH